MDIPREKFSGCFTCLAIGDSFGAFYEGGLLERGLWRVIGKTAEGRNRFTDDTQMSIDVATSFLERQAIDQNHLAETFAASYRWSRGYGPSAGKLLKGVARGKDWRELNRRKFKDGSMGNGAAMRAPIVALCHPVNDDILWEYIGKSAEITHAHPLAIEGAYLIAVATCLALRDATDQEMLDVLLASSEAPAYRYRLEICRSFIQQEKTPDLSEIRRHLGNGILAVESCVTALWFFFQYRDNSLIAMLTDICRLGGDTDTIAAMAGALWGACNGDGEVGDLADRVEDIELIHELAVALYQQC